MKRPTILIASAMVVAGTVLVVAFGGVAGSAAPSNPQPDRQSLVNVLAAGAEAEGTDTPDRPQLDPAAGHVHRHQAAEVKALG